MLRQNQMSAAIQVHPAHGDLCAYDLMEPTPGVYPFTHADWAFRMPSDGIRLLVRFGGGRVVLHSHHHVDVNAWFPEVVELLDRIDCARTVVDAQLSVFDAAG